MQREQSRRSRIEPGWRRHDEVIVPGAQRVQSPAGPAMDIVKGLAQTFDPEDEFRLRELTVRRRRQQIDDMEGFPSRRTSARGSRRRFPFRLGRHLLLDP